MLPEPTFEVIQTPLLTELREKINLKLVAGWALHGAFHVLVHPQYEKIIYIQAIVRPPASVSLAAAARAIKALN